MQTCVIAAVIVGTTLSSTALAQVAPTHNDLIYGVLGSQAQPRPISLDLYIPTVGTGPFPVIVRIHGGGWSGGSNQPIPALYQTLLQQGFAIASVRYRLTSQATQWAPSPVTFPAQINDVKGAVRWLRANASTYNLDPRRVGCCGESAGGHLSALLGASGGVDDYVRNGIFVDIEGNVGGNLQWSSRVQAVADYYGPSDLLNMTPDITNPPGGIDHDSPSSGESRLLGWDDPGQGLGDIRANLENPLAPYPTLAALAFAASPITHVEPTDPPFIVLHGRQDTVVPFRQGERMRDALLAAGVSTQFVVNDTGGHATWPTGNDAIVAFFIDRLITNPPRVCDGDADGDLVVTFSDITAVLAQYGRPGGIGAPGDADANGTVSFSDVSAVLANFGTACP